MRSEFLDTYQIFVHHHNLNTIFARFVNLKIDKRPVATHKFLIYASGFCGYFCRLKIASWWVYLRKRKSPSCQNVDVQQKPLMALRDEDQQNILRFTFKKRSF